MESFRLHLVGFCFWPWSCHAQDHSKRQLLWKLLPSQFTAEGPQSFHKFRNLTLEMKTAEEEIEVCIYLSVSFNPTSNVDLFFLETITSNLKGCEAVKKHGFTLFHRKIE
jgi:hypothetical protein